MRIKLFLFLNLFLAFYHYTGYANLSVPNQEFETAATFVENREYEQAIPILTKLINENPKFLEAFLQRGLAFYYLNELNRAYVDFTKTTKIDSQFAMGYQFSGMVLYRKGLLDDAIVAFDQAIKNDPELGLAYYNRGMAFLHKHRLDLSWNDLIKAKDLGVEVDTALLSDLSSALRESSN